MNRVLLGLTLTALAVPASSETVAGSGFVAPPSSFDIHFAQPAPPGASIMPGFPGHRRHVHRGGYALGGYAGGYYDYGDFDGNRDFDPDKWNDWWHERPERAFPRWVWRNQDCTEDRMWWSGTGWRCTP